MWRLRRTSSGVLRAHVDGANQWSSVGGAGVEGGGRVTLGRTLSRLRAVVRPDGVSSGLRVGGGGGGGDGAESPGAADVGTDGNTTGGGDGDMSRSRGRGGSGIMPRRRRRRVLLSWSWRQLAELLLELEAAILSSALEKWWTTTLVFRQQWRPETGSVSTAAGVNTEQLGQMCNGGEARERAGSTFVVIAFFARLLRRCRTICI